ncbi:hypothetical protein ASC63_12610 [Leifsonia sp. Root112D2]|nr:hypothetical protein ASC63_12610 [Leifsonia sp. Root112D2]
MDLMLPAPYSHGLSLADVLPSSLASLHGQNNAMSLPRTERTVVIVVDGLGAAALRARSGHARYLSARLSKTSTLASGFPTTTAAALATLCTGVTPGKHGLVGYRVFDAAHDRTVNQLNGWDDRLDPARWQRYPTIFEQSSAQGIPSYAIAQARHSDSGFTRAVLRGAQYVPANRISDRFAAARAILDRGGKALIYLYVHELDVAAHAHGWQSDAWLAQLETLDSEMSTLGAGLRAGESALVTADHGVLDVPREAQILFDTVPELVAGVRHVAGDPRCLHLHLEPGGTSGDADSLAERWRDIEGDRAWVATRSEAVAAGWFGAEVDAEVLPRIGDVMVAARRRVTYYDSRETNTASRDMIGQHGSFSDEETRVPLIRLGGYER